MTHSEPNLPAADVEAHLAAALEEYQRAVESGVAPDRAEFLARYPDFADRLENCLNALAFVEVAMMPATRAGPLTTRPLQLGAGSILGEFRILRELGRGGMGVVFEAVQESLGRRVALKVLPLATSAVGQSIQRFRHEAQAAATLQHPHIVPVHAVGHDGDVHYFAMQFIDGESLAVHLKRWQLPASSDSTQLYADATTETAGRSTTVPLTVLPADHFRYVAGLIAQAADALQHAHECGIVHRDIKPGNLLLDAKGHLWVADFGLAKLPGSDLTGTADLLGTLRFMSPEQASGRTVALDGRADVYSLGVTLYELLVRAPAFEADDRPALLRKVLDDEPIPPRKRDRSIPQDLETICLKAMAKDAVDRYPTAGEFRDDLRRFLDDRPIAAKPPSTAHRARKWIRRNRAIVGVASAVTMAAMVIGLVGLAVAVSLIDEKQRTTAGALGRETLAKERADRTLELEQLARAEERRTSYLYAMQLAHREWQSGNVANAERLLEGSPSEHRRWEWHYLKCLARMELGMLDKSMCEGARVTNIQFTEEGQLFAPVTKEFLTWSIPELVRVETVPLAKWSNSHTLTRSPDGTTALMVPIWSQNSIVAARSLGTIDRKTGTRIVEFNETDDKTRVAEFAADSRSVLLGGVSGVISVRDARTGQERSKWKAHAGPILGLSVRRDVIASVGEDNTLRLWMTGSSVPRHSIPVRPWYSANELAGIWTGLDLSPDGSSVALGFPDGHLKVWETATGRILASFSAHSHGVRAVRFSPDGRWVATLGNGDRMVLVWDIQREQLAHSFRGHRQFPLHVQFHPNGRLLASCSNVSDEDGQVRLWDLTAPPGVQYSVGQPVRSRRPLANLRQYRNAIRYSPDGRMIATMLAGDVDLWDPATGRHAKRIETKGPASAEHAIAIEFSTDSRSLIVMRRSGGFSWNIPTGEVSHTIPVETATVRNMLGVPLPVYSDAFSKDRLSRGPMIPFLFPQQVDFTADCRRAIVIRAETIRHLDWHDIQTGNRLRTIGESESPINNVSTSPDGRLIAASSHISQPAGFRFWIAEVETGRIVHDKTYRNDEITGGIFAHAFDPTGERIAFVTVDGSLHVVNVGSGNTEFVVRFHESRSLRFTLFSPDGDRIFCGLDGTTESSSGVRVLDARTGQELLSIPFESGVDGLALGPDVRTLAVADSAGRAWMIDTGPVPNEDRLALWRSRAPAWHREQAEQAQAYGQTEAVRWHRERTTELPKPKAVPNSTELLKKSTGAMKFAPKGGSESEPTVRVNSPQSAYRAAAKYLDAGDAKGYRRVCERLLADLKPDTPAFNVSLAYRIFAMGPDGLGNLKSIAATCEERIKVYRSPSAQHYVLGAIRFRAGEFGAARRSLLESEKYEPESASHSIAWLFLAMTEHRLGHPDEAKRWLAKADDWYAKRTAPTASNEAKLEYQVAIPFPILRKEAAGMLGIK